MKKRKKKKIQNMKFQDPKSENGNRCCKYNLNMLCEN